MEFRQRLFARLCHANGNLLATDRLRFAREEDYFLLMQVGGCMQAGMTPLMMAAEAGCLDAVMALVSSALGKADVNAVNPVRVGG